MNHAAGAPASAHIDLPYGDGTVDLAMPAAWLGAVIQPPPVSMVTDLAADTRRALGAPIDSPRLGALVRPRDRVAVIVDDYTRHTPLAQMLPPLLDELLAAGARPHDILLILARGSHRHMTAAEAEAKLGADLVARYQVVQAPGESHDGLAYLGTMSQEHIPVWIDRTVASAGLRVAVGNITPHMDAGWSGGAKMILPGVCGEVTVDAFHAAGAFIPNNQLGNPDAPLRRSLETVVAAHLPLNFILNAVLTPAGGVCGCVAGHPVLAHRAGVRLAQRAYGARASHKYPVVVAGCSPYDTDLWQSIKGASCGDLLVADGGSLVLVTQAAEGVGRYPAVLAYARQDPGEVRRALAGGAVEDAVEDAKEAVTGIQWHELCRRVRVALVSTGLGPGAAEALGATYYATIGAAIADAVGRLPDEAARRGCVAVIPQAGVTLPLLAPEGDAGGL